MGKQPGKFELLPGKRKGWYFRLKSFNGTILMTSEIYTTKTNARNGITVVQKTISDAMVVEGTGDLPYEE